MTAIGWIEGESRLAEQLRDRVLDGRPYALLDEPLCTHLADGLGPAFGKTAGCPEAYKRWRDALGWLTIDVTPELEYDDRIAAVLDHLADELPLTTAPRSHQRRLARKVWLSLCIKEGATRTSLRLGCSAHLSLLGMGRSV